MKKKFALTFVSVLLVLAALYMAVGYFVYDKLSKVTSGGVRIPKIFPLHMS